MKYKITSIGDYLKIFIDNSLHLCILYNSIISVQSWINRKNSYFIEYTTKQGKVTCEYNDIKKWKTILGLLNTIFE